MSLPKFTPENIIKSIYSSPLNCHRNNMGLVLDISYITDNIIVCSYPVITYPKMFYRNSLKDLVLFLNFHHGFGNWKIYNFKSEICDADYTNDDLLASLDITEYMSSSIESNSLSLLRKTSKNMGIVTFKEVLSNTINKKEVIDSIISRKGWLDHSPPPFSLLQEIIDDIHEFLSRGESKVSVLHCKMGKGRSGTIVIAYLMKYMQCPLKEACQIFLNTRFKAKISRGVTICSQTRYLRYHETFICYDEIYRKEILKEMNLARFKLVSIELTNSIIQSLQSYLKNKFILLVKVQTFNDDRNGLIDIFQVECYEESDSINIHGDKVIIYPSFTIQMSDIALSFGLKAKSSEFINNMSQLSSVGHCWINLYWETLLSTRNESFTNFKLKELILERKRSRSIDSFKMSWENLDGVKGTSIKGVKLFDSLILNWSIM